MDDEEQRRSARYETLGAKVFVGWHGQNAFESTPAEILDLCFEGAAISVAGFPKGIRSAWLRPAGPGNDHIEWASVSVAETRDEPSGKQRVRMKFANSCPYEFFSAIVFPSAALRPKTPSDCRPAELLPTDTSTERQQPASTPSDSRPAELLPRDTSPEARQPEPTPAAGSTAVPVSHIRMAFASKWNSNANRFSR